MAAKFTVSAAVPCGLWDGSRNIDFPATNLKGFRCSRGSRKNFDGGGGGVRPLSLSRAKLLVPFPVIRQRKQIFPRFNEQLISNCGIQPDSVEETAAIQEECHPSDSSGELKYDVFIILTVTLDNLKKLRVCLPLNG